MGIIETLLVLIFAGATVGNLGIGQGRSKKSLKKYPIKPVKQWPDRSIPYSQHSALEREAMDRQDERDCGI